MQNLKRELASLFDQAAAQAFPEMLLPPAEITPATQEQYGHYQYNSAMKIGKTVKQNPRQVAEKILSFLPSGSGWIKRVESAGPGFINIWLREEAVAAELDRLLQASHLTIPPQSHPVRIVIDFSSPNTAKEMHVGHLRSTIIGDCLARLFEFLGYSVLRLNHIGDWGTAFGMLIAHMKERAPEVLEGNVHTDLSHLVIWYKESKKKFDEDPLFKKRAQQEVVLLQAGDGKSKLAWEIICTISRKAYQEIYDLLGVHLEERGESFYNPWLPKITADLEEKGLITISDGAKCIFLEGFTNREGTPLPLMIQKSDGGYNYDTTDMAALYQRVHIERADRLIYVTDAGQSTHFQMIFKACEKAAYFDPSQVRVDHVPFGLVLGPDGKKFKTRSGETEKLLDLLHAAIQRADAILIDRNPEMAEEQRRTIARTLGIGAVKYADLSCNRFGDYTFSYDKMLRFEGNTAVFLLYAYVRIASIKRKVKSAIPQLIQTNRVILEHPSEIALGVEILRFYETLEAMAEDLLPNKLTDYLYGLVEKFNAFFRDCRVEGTAQENSRLLICEATGRILKQGLWLLGVDTVEQM